MVLTIQTKIGAVMMIKISRGVEVPAKEMMIRIKHMMTALDLNLEVLKIGGTLIPKLTLRSISLSFLGILATKTSMNSSPDSVKLKR